MNLDPDVAFVSLSKLARTSVLHCRLKQEVEKNGWFPIQFGLGPNGGENNGRQVANLPEDLDHLVLPCGSGFAAAALLKGINKYLTIEERPRQIHVVQIEGLDREVALQSPIPIKFVAYGVYSYSKKVRLCYKGLDLDSIYEAKAFEWLQKSDLQGRICFWVVGNFNRIRD